MMNHFELAMERFFQKVEKIEDPKVKKLITDIIQYIRDTGSSYYVSYKPETLKIMDQHWNFFSICSEEGEKGFWGYNFSSFSYNEDDEKIIRGVLTFTTNFVSYLSGNSEKTVEKLVKKDEKDFFDFFPHNKCLTVYLLKFYTKEGLLLPNILTFANEASARAAAMEMVPEGCRYEVVSVEVSD